jgi:putative transcriptional regulator
LFNTGVLPDMGAIRNESRRLRFDHGEMMQQELAEKIGLTRQTVNAIELGKYSPSLEAAFRISACSTSHSKAYFTIPTTIPGQFRILRHPRSPRTA